MGRVSTVALAIGVALGAAQVVRPENTNPPVTGDLTAPPRVKQLLRRACYDCHSNETVWPSYGEVAPASWLVSHHVKEGREHLNFSGWADYESDPGTAAEKLRGISRAVASGDMSPWYYRLFHEGARLTDQDRETLSRWAEQEAATKLE